MTGQKLAPGAIVRYATKNQVGKVASVEEDGNVVVVDFHGDPGHRFGRDVIRHSLTLLPDYSLAALTLNQPDEIRWLAKEAPLRLVALLLDDRGGVGKASDLEAKLTGSLGDVKWDTWWNRVRPAIKSSPYFHVAKNNTITLKLPVEAVPKEPLPPQPRAPENREVIVEGWRNWLESDSSEPPPERRPIKGVYAVLDKWPIETIELALDRTMQGARELMWSGLISSQDATAWQDAVVRGAMRWVDCTWPNSSSHLAVQVAETLDILSQHTRRSGWSLFLAGALSGQLDRQQSEFFQGQLKSQRLEQEQERADYENQLERQREEQQRQCLSYEGKLKEQRQEQEQQLARLNAELEAERQAHQTRLEQERREQDRLRQQLQSYQALMASGREESRLEVRRDMLLAVGDALQRAHRPEERAEVRLENAISALVVALREGGAETLETVGESVGFDPQRHHSTAPIRIGASVKVSAPGVVVGKNVILKANVADYSVGAD